MYGKVGQREFESKRFSWWDFNQEWLQTVHRPSTHPEFPLSHAYTPAHTAYEPSPTISCIKTATETPRKGRGRGGCEMWAGVSFGYLQLQPINDYQNFSCSGSAPFKSKNKTLSLWELCLDMKVRDQISSVFGDAPASEKHTQVTADKQLLCYNM